MTAWHGRSSANCSLDKQPTFAGYRKFIFLGPYVVPDAPDHIEQTSPERRNQLLAIFSGALTVQTIARTQAVEITFRNANPNAGAGNRQSSGIRLYPAHLHDPLQRHHEGVGLVIGPTGSTQVGGGGIAIQTLQATKTDRYFRHR